MRREGHDAHLSPSQRLHGKACEQQRRHERLQIRVETAIRRRANPEISTRSRSLPRHDGNLDVAHRLYEQALLSREEALERERLAQKPPRGVTFRPEIHQRSGVLAQRRRARWASLGLDAPDSGGGVAVQEVLLAEGTLYERRRRERQSRQEQVALRLQKQTFNRHSRRLLQNAERRGRSVGTQADSGTMAKPRGSQAIDVDGVEEDDPFVPRLLARDTSNRMLESR